MAGDQNGSVTWKVLASTSAFILWGILAYLAMEIRTDVGSLRSSLATQNTTIELLRQRVDGNTLIISTLDTEHRTLSRDVTGIQDQMRYWQQAYGWTGRKGR